VISLRAKYPIDLQQYNEFLCYFDPSQGAKPSVTDTSAPRPMATAASLKGKRKLAAAPGEEARASDTGTFA
jgi:hypothetical protein